MHLKPGRIIQSSRAAFSGTCTIHVLRDDTDLVIAGCLGEGRLNRAQQMQVTSRTVPFRRIARESAELRPTTLAS